MKRAVLFLALIAVLAMAATASAAPLPNQIVPVGVINTGAAVGQDAFGVAYDSKNNLIWHYVGGSNLHAFTPFKDLFIPGLPIDGFTGLPMLNVTTGQTTPSPNPGLIQAIGFNKLTGQLVMHNNGVPGVVQGFDVFTGANLNAYLTPMPAGTQFLDGLDVEGGDVYSSSEPSATGRDSYKNGVLFLDNTNPAQTDISSISAGTSITRWAGIEAVSELGFIYAVSEVDFGGGPVGRSIGVYDFLGTFFAFDPDGSPFASRLEDLAFDGRYLYAGSIGDARIFVFDITGPGGLAIPEPTTLATMSLLGLAVLGYARRQQRNQKLVA
jgi:hypothetical protein